MLIEGEGYRSIFESALATSTRGFFYTAFFSSVGAGWLCQHRDIKSTDRLLVRGRPDDFLSGACSFEGLRMVLNRGLALRASSALHAKVFAFDDFILSGSANMTARGLALIDGANIELGIKSELDQRDLQLLDNLWDQGVPLTLEKLALMQEHLESLRSRGELEPVVSDWPTEIFHEKRDLYCVDFPNELNRNEQCWADVLSFQRSAAYRWLLDVVDECGEASFGFLSSRLHGELYDDPVPYRATVKELLSSLLDLVTKLGPKDLEVVRPKHRQVVRRKVH